MMISIIICSYKKDLLQKASQSVESTIGVPYEIIVIDNATGQYGICKAYNEGAAKAKFDILCFMHEDITLETANWGNNVVKHLSNTEVGLIGVAGGDTKSLVPSGWASMTFKSEIHMVQHYKNKDKEAHKILETAYPGDKSNCKRVACIDGVWMCTRKEVFEKYKFDDNFFKGFHAYDIDYSMQVNTAYNVCVVFDVLVHHYSEGVLAKEWMESTLLISKKWKKQLPFSVREISKKEMIRQHWTAMSVFIEILIELKYSYFQVNSYLLKYSFNRYFHLMHFLHFVKLINKEANSKSKQ